MNKGLLLLLCLFLVAAPLTAQGEVPAPLFKDLKIIEKNKQVAETGQVDIQNAIKQLIVFAEEKMDAGPYSVVFSKKNSPLGSVHDYCSMSPYWWPDPEKEDGLPYIRKDGIVNPERNEYDKTQSSDLRDAVEILTMAYLYSGNQKYAQRAIELIKIWFLDDETHMNPNMEFAQFVPGKSSGRSYGIIESRVLMYILDDANILYHKGQMDIDSYYRLNEWSRQFLHWLVFSDHGKKEHAAKNNHGSWYDTQTLAFALLVGDETVQKDLVSGYIGKRISGHILANGKQPEELVRTRSFSYSNFNLNAIVEFYCLAMNHDLLSETQSKIIRRGILRGAKFLYPSALNPEKWPYQQIKAFDDGQMKLAQTYFTMDVLHPGKGYWKKAMSIPQEEVNKIILILNNDTFKGE